MPDELQVAQRRAEVFGWGVFMLCMGLLGYGFSQQIARVLDFSAFYGAGHVLRDSATRLYDMQLQAEVQRQFVASGRFMPFYHPAYEALLYLPLSFLSFRAAYVTYLVGNLILLALVYRLAPTAAAPCLRRVPRMLLFFASVPVLFCLVEGQNSILFLLLLIGVWSLIGRGAYVSAGLLLGVGIFKLPLTPIIALLLALRFGWRFLGGAVASGCGMILVSAWMTGVGGTKAWIAVMRLAAAAPGMNAHEQNVMRVLPEGMTNLSGLLYVAGSRLFAVRPPALFGLAASIVVLMVCALLMRRLPRAADAFSVAVMGALLAGPHVSLHDMALLLIPVLLSSGYLFGSWVVVVYALPFALFLVDPPRLLAVDALAPLLFVIATAYETMARKEDRPAASDGLRGEVPDVVRESSIAMMECDVSEPRMPA